MRRKEREREREREKEKEHGFYQDDSKAGHVTAVARDLIAVDFCYATGV